MNSIVISGTPRMISMKAMQMDLMIGMSDWRPSASKIASGNENTMPVTAMISVTGRPPHMSVSTRRRPKMPPCIKMYITGTATSHATSSQRLRKREFTETAIIANKSSIISVGRHCSSCG